MFHALEVERMEKTCLKIIFKGLTNAYPAKLSGFNFNLF